jgi:hypothetical protein
MRILLMNQHAWRPVTFGMNTNHRICWNWLSLCTYQYFLLVLPFGGYCCKLCSSENPRKKKLQGLRSGERTSQIPLLIVLSPRTSDKACIDVRAA